MKIIIVGASGTIGKYLTDAFKEGHDIISVGSASGDIRADITSPDAVEHMYRQAGAFDALICTAGPAYFGPWKGMDDKAFRKGIDGKLMGQVNLVLCGQAYIRSGGSFTLTTGILARTPQKQFANASAVNGAVEAFVRAAAIELENGIRINAVSPSVIEDSPQYFPYFPGEIPTTMKALEYAFRKSVFGAGTGQVITV